MGQPGIDVVAKVLSDVKAKHSIDLVIAQAENVTKGKSMSPPDMQILQDIGVDFFSGGNHTPKNSALNKLLPDNNQPVIGPANLVECPGRGWKYIKTAAGKVLVISMLGGVVGKAAEMDIENPLKTIDSILAENKGVERAATIINFHGDYSSEKRVFGYYLDGQVSAVIGDHWHVPTADAMILPKGTAHITDVGMCGSLHSSLGVKLDVIIPRWRDGVVNKNELELSGSTQFNAVVVDVDQNGLAKSIKHIQQIIN